LVTKQQVQQSELENLCNRIFAGSSKDFILSFISRENVSEEELAQIKQTVNEYHR
jgi:predicted transcriptional regulator